MSVVLPNGVTLGGVTAGVGRLKEAKRTLREEFERQYLLAVIKRFDGHIARSASHAGLGQEYFGRLLYKYGIDANDFRLVPIRSRRDTSCSQCKRRYVS